MSKTNGSGFHKAQRHEVRLLAGFLGPSGSGKSYSALRVAQGLAAGGRIALIDTEHRRSELYADVFDFDVLHLDPPFEPERYIEAIRQAEDEGYEVLIIDSATHEWSGPGGILEIKDAMTKHMKNAFQAWSTLTPRHNAFLNAMQYSSCHIIATMRGKDVWNVEPDENGKVKPRKVAQGGDQRSGFEYEFMLTFMIDQESHIATPSKDNTGLFGGRFEVLTEDHGKRLREWATSGKSQDVLLRELTDAAADYAAELKQIYDAHKEGFTEKQCAYIERFINAGAPTDVHAAREFRAQIENAYNAITASLAQREAAVAQG